MQPINVGEGTLVYEDDFFREWLSTAVLRAVQLKAKEVWNDVWSRKVSGVLENAIHMCPVELVPDSGTTASASGLPQRESCVSL